jgi:hypothetical protein
VTLVANAFLEAMAEVTIAHLLLQAALIADGKRIQGDEQSQDDFDFYSGKVMAAKYYVNYVLPGVHAKVGAIVAGDRSPLDVTDGGFSGAY